MFVTTDPIGMGLSSAMLAALAALQGGANMAAAGPTTMIVPAAAGEPATALYAAFCAGHASASQAALAEALMWHAALAGNIGTSGVAYAGTEAANMGGLG